MEVLSSLLEHVVAHPSFLFHSKCKKKRISHLCFTDDLILLCKANEASFALLKNTLDIFSHWSRVDDKDTKSQIFFTSTCNEGKRNLARTMGFDIDCLLLSIWVFLLLLPS